MLFRKIELIKSWVAWIVVLIRTPFSELITDILAIARVLKAFNNGYGGIRRSKKSLIGFSGGGARLHTESMPIEWVKCM